MIIIRERVYQCHRVCQYNKSLEPLVYIILTIYYRLISITFVASISISISFSISISISISLSISISNMIMMKINIILAGAWSLVAN